MIATIHKTHSVHHRIDVLKDFARIGDGQMRCGHCKQIVDSGLINVIKHIESCEEHPVFIQTGYDWKKMEAIGEEMTYGEYLKRKESYKN